MSGKRSALVIVVLLAGTLVLWWVFSGQAGSVGKSFVLEKYSQTKFIEIRHTQNGGAHIYSGSIDTSSPCDEVSTGVVSRGTSTLHITLRIGITKQSSVCAASVSAQPFEFSVESGGSAVVLDGVEINGLAAEYAILESK